VPLPCAAIWITDAVALASRPRATDAITDTDIIYTRGTQAYARARASEVL